MTQASLLACVTLGALGLSACSRGTHRAAPAIPPPSGVGQPGTATTSASPDATHLPACNAANLTLAGSLNGAAGAVVIYFVAVSKHQLAPCEVDELLSIRVLKGPTGPALPIQPSPFVYRAHEIVLSPNQMAQAGDPSWAWENWCGPSDPSYVVAASAPGMGTLDLGLNGSFPACLDHTRPSLIAPFTSTGPAPFR